MHPSRRNFRLVALMLTCVLSQPHHWHRPSRAFHSHSVFVIDGRRFGGLWPCIPTPLEGTGSTKSAGRSVGGWVKCRTGQIGIACHLHAIVALKVWTVIHGISFGLVCTLPPDCPPGLPACTRGSQLLCRQLVYLVVGRSFVGLLMRGSGIPNRCR